jgi:signal transduction histidine kinase
VYNRKYLALCKKLKLSLQEADALSEMANTMASTNPVNGISFLSKAQNLVENPVNKNLLSAFYFKMMEVPSSVLTAGEYRKYVLAKVNLTYGAIYWLNNYHKRAFVYFQKALDVSRSIQAYDLITQSNISLGVTSENRDSCLYFLQTARRLAIQNDFKDMQADAENFMAQWYSFSHDISLEFTYRRSSLELSMRLGRISHVGWSYVGMADYYARSKKIKDSVLWYAHKAVTIAQQTHNPNMEYWSAIHLSDVYEAEGNKDSAYKYLQMRLASKEKISSDENARQFEGTDYTMQAQQQALEDAQQQFNNKLKIYSLLAGIAVLTLLAIIFWRNNKRKQKEFALLQRQKAKTDEALKELKATQAQLIQQEKMASLGELTAGIAHEIQNPLNFVNNFSEVNKELISEMRNEIEMGNFDEAKTIAKNIEENEEKIISHGRRADGIVKGMLMHSRTSTGQKELTDINALADEYLRLSYHGLRARDKSFNAKFETDFDPSIPKINIVPQDIGRVILNLINNAFYAVNEKAKLRAASYEPTVIVSTRKVNGKVEVKVKDNGNGIPDSIKDKIFQPFFTTKPAGQGTGLGLSLSYDIITKGHGGELRVATTEGEGSKFIIQLPVV